MLIGLLSDIHEAVELAREAIAELRRRKVERIICLGDFCKMEERITEMCTLLSREEVMCVWGNHDFGLCKEAREGKAQGYTTVVQQFARAVRPAITFESFHFSHVDPWLDPNNFEDLWYYGASAECDEVRDRIFATSCWDIAFAGHYHRWLAYTADGPVAWSGQTKLDLSQQRHFVVVSACADGHFATFDTNTRVLTPLRCELGD